MSPYTVLDILLLILLALFVPIGIWRGAQREVLVTFGILLGVVLGQFWAQPWGGVLARWTGLSQNGGAFLVAMICLVAGTFLIGYGLGSAMLMPPPGTLGRLAGAVVAAVNGALVLGFALQHIQGYLLAGSSIRLFDQAVVAHYLSTGVGWLLLAGAVALLVTILGLVLFGQSGTIVVYEEGMPSEAAPVAQQTRRYVPGGVETKTAYKTEPPRRPTEETRPLRATEVEPGGRVRGNLGDQETAVIARPATPAAEETRRQAPLETGKCPYCHADLDGTELFCPRCGHVL